jgi:hypothetical protein
LSPALARAAARRALPLALLLGGALLASAASHDVWRLAAPLTDSTAPATGLGSAKLRAALSRLGVLALQPPTTEALERSAATGECPDYRIGGAAPAPEAQPASVSAPAPDREQAPVLVSLWVDPCRLARLHERPWDRGRSTEQSGWIALYERGRLRFASAVGVRIHGGISRQAPPYSYRIYFRGDYGEPGLPPELLSSALVAPVARIYLDESLDFDRDLRRFHFPAEIAYEVGRRLGARAPRTRPVRFSLNGQESSIYVLGEHLGEDYLERHFGHRNFDFIRGKRQGEDPTEALWRGEIDWIQAAPRPFTAELAARRYDLDQLTTWLATVLFCATGDLYQDAMVRDRSGEVAGGRWTWIHWDHDMSFRTPPGNSRFGRQREVLPFILWNGRGNEIAPSRELARRLLREDPGYRRRLTERVRRALREELTPDFLEQLVARHESLARELGADDLHFAERLRAFFAARPAEVEAQLAELARVDESSEDASEVARRRWRRRAAARQADPGSGVR